MRQVEEDRAARADQIHPVRQLSRPVGDMLEAVRTEDIIQRFSREIRHFSTGAGTAPHVDGHCARQRPEAGANIHAGAVTILFCRARDEMARPTDHDDIRVKSTLVFPTAGPTPQFRLSEEGTVVAEKIGCVGKFFERNQQRVARKAQRDAAQFAKNFP